jgi:hypothetical protein
MDLFSGSLEFLKNYTVYLKKKNLKLIKIMLKISSKTYFKHKNSNITYFIRI